MFVIGDRESKDDVVDGTDEETGAGGSADRGAASAGAAPPARPKRRRATWRKRLVALCLGGLFAALGAELLVRATRGAPLPERWPLGLVEAHPTRGWRMVPGDAHYTYHHPVRVNALGLRGPEVSAEKPAGERRVLALGDSMVYGQGVAEEDTVPAQLEAMLNERAADGETWRVVNAGHRAYATHQELALLEELGARIAPDVVVLFWFDNDFDQPTIESLYRYRTELGVEPFDVEFAGEEPSGMKWRVRKVLRSSAAVMLVHDAIRDRLLPVKEEEFWSEGFAALEEQLPRFVELCGELGARPVVAIIPRSTSVAADDEAAARARRVADRARAHGLETIELLDPMRDRCAEAGVIPTIPYDGHYTGRGNGWLAEPVAEALGGE